MLKMLSIITGELLFFAHLSKEFRLPSPELDEADAIW